MQTLKIKCRNLGYAKTNGVERAADAAIELAKRRQWTRRRERILSAGVVGYFVLSRVKTHNITIMCTRPQAALCVQSDCIIKRRFAQNQYGKTAAVYTRNNII